jgi:hypothetical protein
MGARGVRLRVRPRRYEGCGRTGAPADRGADGTSGAVRVRPGTGRRRGTSPGARRGLARAPPPTAFADGHEPGTAAKAICCSAACRGGLSGNTPRLGRAGALVPAPGASAGYAARAGVGARGPALRVQPRRDGGGGGTGAPANRGADCTDGAVRVRPGPGRRRGTSCGARRGLARATWSCSRVGDRFPAFPRASHQVLRIGGSAGGRAIDT